MGGRWLLFDNEEGPCQFENVVLDAAYEEVVNRLDRCLDEWLDRLEDRFLSTTDVVREYGLVEEWYLRGCASSVSPTTDGAATPTALDATVA